jgi:hypothetical protein
MKRRLPSLAETGQASGYAIPDGVYLVRVEGAQYRWHAQEPFYTLQLRILEPHPLAGYTIAAVTTKAMWKLGWFLRDFLYDPELLSQSEVEERALRGLVGIVKISHTVINGIRLVNFDGFAPASSGKSSPRRSKLVRK